MNTFSNRAFSRKPLVAALAAVLVAPVVLAGSFNPNTPLPSNNQLPGAGLLPAGVTGGTFTPGAVTPTVGTVAAGATGNAVQLDVTRAVVTWGDAAPNFNANATGGFNIGSDQTFYVVNNSGGPAALLNVDVSGATSVIAGKLAGAVVAGNLYPDIYVANANGIIVTGSAVITTGPLSSDDAAAGSTVAGGLGLLGLDMKGSSAQQAFTSETTVGSLPSVSKLNLDFANAAPVRIDAGATISGGAGAIAQNPTVAPTVETQNGASYVLLAGADSGATPGVSNAGLITTNQFLANAGSVVNSSGKGAQAVFQPNFTAGPVWSGGVDIPYSSSGFVNYGYWGSPTTASSSFTAVPGSFTNTGTIRDMALYSNYGEETYVVANGTITNSSSGRITAGSDVVPSDIWFNGKGIVNAGSLQTFGLYAEFGSDGVDLGGTITNFAGALSYENRLAFVDIYPHVVSGVVQQGDVNISAPITIHADFNDWGGFYVEGRNITLSSDILVTPLPGQSAGSAEMAELHTTKVGGVITVDETGSLTAGSVLIGSDIGWGAPYAWSPDLPNLVLAGSITTTNTYGQIYDENADWGWSNFEYYPDFVFNGMSITGSGVAGQGSITANVYDIYARGNVRSPVSESDFLQNGLNLTPRTGNASTPQVAISAVGSGAQAINLNITGPVEIYSGVTVTPFANAQLTSGTNQAGAPVPNVQSSLIVQSTGDVNVAGGFQSESTPADPLGQEYVAGTFYFPGGAVFKSDTGVYTGNIMNAWNTLGIPFQGVFFEAPVIQTGWIAMSANQFANFSTSPVTAPVTYQLVLGNNGATVNFLPGSYAYRTGNPANACGAGAGDACTNTYSAILDASLAGEDWVSIVNTTPFN